MSESTGIEWCDSTFNPWVGCTKVSPACDHCYAEGWAKRSGMVKWGNEPRRRTSAANWREPIKWQATAAEFEQQHGHRRRVFCASLADVFDNQVPAEWRHDLWSLIEQCWGMDWLLLTKRPQNIEKMLPDATTWENIRGRVWLGTTVEDQQRADQNIPHLLRHDAAVRFVSIEPMLGPVDLTDVKTPRLGSPSAGMVHPKRVNTLTGWAGHYSAGDHASANSVFIPNSHRLNHVDWVIAGGESGPHARQSHPDWFVSLHEQCKAAGVPFLFKQWGEYLPEMIGPEDARSNDFPPGHVIYHRLGKKAAGRNLLGVEHNGFPATSLARAAA